MTDGNAISVEAARALLLHVMEWDSEESYCAGWISGNEYRLWCQVVRDPVVAGEVRDQPIYQQLRELSAVAGGWWVWSAEMTPTPGRSFVTLTDWLPMYEAHRQALLEKYGPEGWAAALPRVGEEQRAFWDDFLESTEKCASEAPANTEKDKPDSGRPEIHHTNGETPCRKTNPS